VEGKCSCSIIPLRAMTEAMLARGSKRAPKAEAAAANNGKAHPSSSISTNRGVGVAPLLRKKVGELVQQASDSAPKRRVAIRRKGTKVRRCRRQASRYGFFLARAAERRTLPPVRFWWGAKGW